MKRFGPLVALLLVTPACAEIDPTVAGVCGNGVVEPATEDCDGFVDPALGGTGCGAPGDAARACRLLCQNRTDCAPGSECTPGGFCQHAAGRFEAGGAADFTASRWAARDVDGDDAIDLIGVRPGELAIAFGDGFGSFERAAGEPVLETVHGRPAFGDLDLDGLADAAVPSAGGVLVFRGTNDRAEPFATGAPAVLTDSLTFTMRPKWKDPTLGAVSFALIQTGQSVQFLDPTAYFAPAQSIQGWGSMKMIAGEVGDLDGDSADEVVLVHAASPAEIAVFTTDRSPDFLGGFTEDEEWPRTTLGSEARVGARPIIADTDGDSNPEIVVTLADGSLIRMPAKPRALGDAEAFTLKLAEDRTGTGIVPVTGPLAATDMNADGTLDWLTPEGVLLGNPASNGSPTELVRVHASERGKKWLEAVAVRLNQDPWPDLAVATATSEQVTQLLLLRAKCLDRAPTSDGSCVRLVFTPERVPTSGNPRGLRSADFDGDLFDDVAFIDGLEGEDLVRVRFSPGVGIAETRTLLRLPPGVHMDAGLYRTPLGYDGASDLGVGAFVVLPGNASRASYLPLLLTDLFLNDKQAALDVWMGAFFDPGTAPGLVAVTPQGRLHRFDAPVLDEPISEGGSLQTTGLVCSSNTASSSAIAWTSFDADGDGDGLDELVGLAPRAECPDTGPVVLRTFHPSTNTLDDAVRIETIGAVNDVASSDVDGDARPDLIAADEKGVHVLFGPDFTDHLLLGETPEAPIAIAVIQADADPLDEIAVVTAARVLIFDPTTRAEPARMLWDIDLGGDSIASADVNGDDLQDLLVGDGQQIQILLSVPHVRAPAEGATP